MIFPILRSIVFPFFLQMNKAYKQMLAAIHPINATWGTDINNNNHDDDDDRDF